MEAQTDMDNNQLELKQNLISGLMSLKNKYPDCIWLEECLVMNQINNQTVQIGSLSQITTHDILVSNN